MFFVFCRCRSQLSRAHRTGPGSVGRANHRTLWYSHSLVASFLRIRSARHALNAVSYTRVDVVLRVSDVARRGAGSCSISSDSSVQLPRNIVDARRANCRRPWRQRSWTSSRRTGRAPFPTAHEQSGFGLGTRILHKTSMQLFSRARAPGTRLPSVPTPPPHHSTIYAAVCCARVWVPRSYGDDFVYCALHGLHSFLLLC